MRAVKGQQGGPLGHNFRNTLNILKLMVKSKKKKVLGVLNGSF